MSQIEEQIAKETLERYAGCSTAEFQEHLILTNFPKYVQYFAETKNAKIQEGSMFKVAHSKDENISILDFKIGSPAAALTIDTCSFLPFKTSIFLGMCGGLRRRYQVGDYLVPVASIRAEGTSDYYFPIEVPALANFLMQKAVTNVMEEEKKTYHIGITYTTNMRFWEFKESFTERLKSTKAQGIEMECATLFTASYKRKFTLGSLLLISDLPLKEAKTKQASQDVYDNFAKEHVELGIKIIKSASEMVKKRIKGAYYRDVSKS